MKKNESLKIIYLFCFSFLLASCNSSSSGWSGWRGEDRDAKVDGFEVPAEWPETLTEVWQTEVGLANSSPVMVDGKLFLHVKDGEKQKALCIDPSNATRIWETVLNEAPEVTGGARNHPGPRSTPFVGGGKMFTLGVGGTLHCLDAGTGEILWKVDRYDEVPQFYPSMSPLVVNNMCVVHLGGHENGVVAAFNVETGETIWTIEGEPATYSSPVTMNVGGEEILVVQTEVDLIGVSFDGEVLWRIPTPGERRFYNSSTPVVDGQNVIVAGQGLGTKSFAIEKSDDEYSYKMNWHNPDYGVSFNTPVLNDGYLYAHEAQRGKLFCLNATTGETAWADTTAHNRFAAMLNLGDVMVTLPANGNLIFFESNPEDYIEIEMYKVSETEVYAHPVVVGATIYVKDENNLICYEL